MSQQIVDAMVKNIDNAVIFGDVDGLVYQYEGNSLFVTEPGDGDAITGVSMCGLSIPLSTVNLDALHKAAIGAREAWHQQCVVNILETGL